MREKKKQALNITVCIEGVLFLSVGIYSIVEGIRLIGIKGVGQIDVFGPGRYVFALGAAFIILGLIYIISNSGKESLKLETGMRVKMISMIACLVLYLFLINIVGFLLASVIFFLVIFRISGFRSWPLIVGISIGSSISFYLLFVYLLDMMFPRGLLFK